MSDESPLKLVDDAKVAPQADDPTLDTRQTDELVFAFVGPIGSGVTHTANLVLARMKTTFDYSAELLKVSKIIQNDAGKVGQVPKADSAIERIDSLQKIGNMLREKYGADYLARRAIEHISDSRTRGAATEDEARTLRQNAAPRRYVTIIDSLKRPEEIELLRRVYGDLLHVFCVFAPEGIRSKRLGNGAYKASQVDRVFEIDEDEGSRVGQRVRDTAYLADFFLRNDQENDVSLSKSVDRFLEIVFGTQIHTPTVDETAMYAAIAAARGSACLSRQVGAVIYNEAGEQIGRGCNDVPKFGGGLYGSEDGDKDHRCYRWGGKICHNDEQKGVRFDEIVLSLEGAGLVDKGERAETRRVVSQTRIKDLIEFSRAVHAEMEAIISVARNGNAGLVGSTLYCTTYPCHSCARHIIASGIARVVYVEPYAKSLAGVLHSDAMNVGASGRKGVLFQQYQGVAPRNIDRLFSARGERKRSGKLFVTIPREALPVCMGPLDGIGIRENLVITQTSAKELLAEERAND